MKEYTVKLNVGEYGVSILLQARGKKISCIFTTFLYNSYIDLSCPLDSGCI